MSASLNMCKTTLMLACLACLCHGRRVQPSDVLREAFVASKSAPAFNPSNMPMDRPNLAVARPRVRVTSMAVDAPMRGQPGYKRSLVKGFISNLNPFKTGKAAAEAKAAAQVAEAAETAKAEAEAEESAAALATALMAKAEAEAGDAAEVSEKAIADAEAKEAKVWHGGANEHWQPSWMRPSWQPSWAK
mmetsp:Transcript_86040/g.152404  ORF Transcript_86040/g.152404 Transcript_86040/m.152404 type:complete len:189 (-) Transcript_86040:250-816(-)